MSISTSIAIMLVSEIGEGTRRERTLPERSYNEKVCEVIFKQPFNTEMGVLFSNGWGGGHNKLSKYLRLI